jgi:hypothetical protein
MAARRGYWLRHPRTTQELRANPTRAKRRSIPTAWDDISRCVERCWKAQRRLKWRRIARMS